MNREHIKQDELRINDTLFYLCVFVTLVAVGVTLFRFFGYGRTGVVSMNAFYIGVIAIYALHKEAMRWILDGTEVSTHRHGEKFVYFWIIVVAILFLINFVSGGAYPGDREGAILTDTSLMALEVGAFFLIARIAKIARICKS